MAARDVIVPAVPDKGESDRQRHLSTAVTVSYPTLRA